MTSPSTGSLFRDGDFRRLWAIGLISFLVRWLEILVFGIFVYQQTGSAFMVASMTMLRLLPLALFVSMTKSSDFPVLPAASRDTARA